MPHDWFWLVVYAVGVLIALVVLAFLLSSLKSKNDDDDDDPQQYTAI